MAKRKAVIIGYDRAIVNMFQQHGWDAEETIAANAGVDFLRDKDMLERMGTVHLLVFTGGEDVSPSYYDEKAIPQVRFTNPRRDQVERTVFNYNRNIPKVGICRGGQLLNVLSGGSMWQHVDHHTSTHDMIDLRTQEILKVTSTHHQMMRAHPAQGEVLAIAHEAKEFLSANKDLEKPAYDTEVVFYRNTNSLCFQPHPEYHDDDTRKVFFNLLEDLWKYTPEYEERVTH